MLRVVKNNIAYHSHVIVYFNNFENNSISKHLTFY